MDTYINDRIVVANYGYNYQVIFSYDTINSARCGISLRVLSDENEGALQYTSNINGVKLGP
jgi:hypothetical protein